MGLAKDEREAAAKGEGVLGRAADEEPVFVLRAQDRFAPELVEYWAHLVNSASGGKSTDKVSEAIVLADKMRSWQRLNKSKIPD